MEEEGRGRKVVKMMMGLCCLPVLVPSAFIVGVSFCSLVMVPLGCGALGALATPYFDALLRTLIHHDDSHPSPHPLIHASFHPSFRFVDLSCKEDEQESILEAIDLVKRIVGYVAPQYFSITQQIEGLCNFTGLQLPYAYEDLSLQDIKEQLILLEILVGIKPLSHTRLRNK